MVSLAWFAKPAVDQWFASASWATSGGDGAARLLEIGPAVARLRHVTAEQDGGRS